MDSSFFIDSAFANIKILEELYEKYEKNPSEIDPKIQRFFESLDDRKQKNAVLENVNLDDDIPNHLSIGTVTPEIQENRLKDQMKEHLGMRITQLINTFRTYGHLAAKFNPIELEPSNEPNQLKLIYLGFCAEELGTLFPTFGLMEEKEAALEEIIATLKKIYCGNIGIEYMRIQSLEIQKWIQEHVESNQLKESLSIEEKKIILQHLNKSELFENFLHTKYVGQKRFSLEGGETLIPILAAAMNKGADLGIEHFVLGMAHRGRLNVLSNILDKSYSAIFSEFEDRWIPNSFEGSGDVKYHKGFSSFKKSYSGKEIQVDLAPNPSHLEAVNPVVEGRVRAKQVLLQEGKAKSKVIPILIHGDAALSGQGIVYETMQLYELDGYSNGGTLHIVINNQIGFTTLPKDNRSTFYCTDIARAFNAPVFHVNAEDPEGCVHATYLALAIRQKFQCDVFIDLYCYRKYGHNEADEPAFTQPLEYQLIRQKRPIREIYRDQLIQQGILEKSIAEALEAEFKDSLQKALDGTKFPDENLEQRPDLDTLTSNSLEEMHEMLATIETGVDKKILIEIGKKICNVPSEFNLHRKLTQLNGDRLAMLQGEKRIDWGMGELLAYGSLLWENTSIRLTGQDTCRGTFSHRHALFMDQIRDLAYFPLQHLKEGQGRFDIYNSPLSEYAALGFEYGYSLSAPDSLILWEAQFGDFANGAQVIIDQFITTSEQKWEQKNNLVMLLPHGYEGQGPEHSSARVERFLALAGNNNMFITNPTSPAQLFHLLRRQIHNHLLKPLMIFTPKFLLRHPACTSSLANFTEGAFQEIIDDPQELHEEATQLAFCSGKVYYDLVAEREMRHANALAIVRIEQLYPLHQKKLIAILSKYTHCKSYYWVQEEPENMGAWWYISSKLRELLPENVRLTYIGRKESAASATGSIGRHRQEYEAFMGELFNGSKDSHGDEKSKNSSESL